MIKITNISGGELVCDLKDGETLRLSNRETTNITEDNVTDYLENIAEKNLIILERLSTNTYSNTTPTPKKEDKKKKGEVEEKEVVEKEE